MAMSVAGSGKNLTGKEDMAQSLGLYFITPKGSICLHPELGFGIFDYVDKNAADVLKMTREIRTGIQLWDPRIIVKSAKPLFDKGKLKVTITWYPADDATNIIQQQIFV